jgi:hypothetical protein
MMAQQTRRRYAVPAPDTRNVGPMNMTRNILGVGVVFLLTSCATDPRNARQTIVDHCVGILRADGRDGACVILKNRDSHDWIQFAILGDRGLHFDFPTLWITSTDAALFPYQRVERLPDVPNGTRQTPFTSAQIASLKSCLDTNGIEHYRYGQACFGTNGIARGAGESLQFDLSWDRRDLAKTIDDIFAAAHPGSKIMGYEITHFKIEWDQPANAPYSSSAADSKR